MTSNDEKVPVVAKLVAEIKKLTEEKDAAYLERNQLVSALAYIFPSGITRTKAQGVDTEWQGCVYVDLPTGQASWHFHDRDAWLFEDLPHYTRPYDGHTKEEKYRRLMCAFPSRIGPPLIERMQTKCDATVAALKDERACALDRARRAEDALADALWHRKRVEGERDAARKRLEDMKREKV